METRTYNGVTVTLEVWVNARGFGAEVTTNSHVPSVDGVSLTRKGFDSVEDARAWAERVAPHVAAEERRRLEGES